MKITSIPTVRCLRLFALCLGFTLWIASTAPLTADTLKLKNGTTVEGDIVGENDQAILLQVSFDNGSITTRRTYLKSDIDEVFKTSPEEKRKEKMEYWYGKVKRYQLTDNSFQLEYYDQVINDVFKKYQSVFPESPYTKEVQDLQAHWQAERVRVAAGEVKRDGKWMTTAQADQMTQDQKAQSVVNTARSLVASKEYRMAWLQLAKANKISQSPDITKQIIEVGREAYMNYVQNLAIKENWLKTQIDYLERRDARTNIAAANLEHQATFATGSKISVSGDDERVLRSAEVQGDAVRANAARSDQVLAEFRNKLAQVQDEMAQLKQKKADWDAGMEVGNLKKSDVGK